MARQIYCDVCDHLWVLLSKDFVNTRVFLAWLDMIKAEHILLGDGDNND